MQVTIIDMEQVESNIYNQKVNMIGNQKQKQII